MASIDIDSSAGYCFGVEQVIHTAEGFLEKGETVYALGAPVHNSAEMKRLESLGMKVIRHRDLAGLKPDRVLIRAHGEPPSTYELAGREGIGIIDGTCPIVKKLQKRIREAYLGMDRSQEQLVIFGKQDHPETIGILGQVKGDAVVVEGPEDVSRTDPRKRAVLFSQTTMDPDRFRETAAALKDHTAGVTGMEFRSECTICGQMKRRKPQLSSFASSHEVVLFVSGMHSSNGKMLFEFCRSVNPASYWISCPEELQPEWVSGAERIGISGATSTSLTQLEAVRDHVEKLLSP